MSLINKLIPTVLIALAVIITGYILGTSYLTRGKSDPSVSVKGLGQQSFDSDLIVWRASFSRNSLDLKDAYADLNADIEKVKGYLEKQGISEDETVFDAADINKKYDRIYDENGNFKENVFRGYELNQSFEVQSKSVDMVEKTSRDVSKLIDAGIELNSYSPQYYYTQLAALKIKMIEAATKDAKNRAVTIANSGGGILGKLTKANMGVFQITAENSSDEYSWGGSFNTTSKRKTASITMRLNYEID
ncbi:MAG: SIMPL domain-containing protein [Crocinitomicaceae bacterium]